MRFGSVCSGIEAASVAWAPLGWTPAWFAEIEPFPSAVLAHHYPGVDNLGDITRIPDLLRAGLVDAPDILCGGTPCQAFSAAGLRRSLDDARGNLSLTFCEIADAIDEQRPDDPCIVFWENVPGVLNTKDNAFGCFLAGLAGEDMPLEPPGGKWSDAGAVFGPTRTVAWRVLDAQYFGLAQRRRRVFVVASAREGFDPAAVLFEWEGVRRDSAPSREAGEEPAAGALRSTDGGSDANHGHGHLIPQAFGGNRTSGSIDVAPALLAQPGSGWKGDFESETFLVQPAHTLRGEGFDASEDGTGRGTGLVPVAFQPGNLSRGAGSEPSTDVFPTLKADPGRGRSDQDPHVMVPVSVALRGRDGGATAEVGDDVAFTLRASEGGGDKPHVLAHAFDARQHDVLQYGDKTGPLARGAHPPAIAFSSKDHAGSHANGGGQMAVAHSVCLGSDPIHARELAQPITRRNGDPGTIATAMQVRRLTPRECERLQGFPDDYTLIPWRGKPAADCPDGPRYKALGNSWAVPVVTWIGVRIAWQLLV